ncbi:MAG: imidazoleglycerol-phosphate dehydratase [Candidatus Omnitrophica bacterium]|nr:imidazoleglycerol-phosphate dehydratase [Candidatus Omnitrophota bacterium]
MTNDITKRTAIIKRKTNEVDINGSFNIDGGGKTDIKTGFEPLNHLLTLFTFHGLFDLEIKAEGDLPHHIIEDIGIALGKAFKQALGEKEGINRYGCFTVAMDKVAVEAVIDISGRPSIHGRTLDKGNNGLADFLDSFKFDNTDFTARHAEEFLESFLQHSGISLVYMIKSSEGDLHHILEALFKAMGKALDQATFIDNRRKGIPSTKGIID